MSATSSQKPLGFGIVGAGLVASFHAKAIQATPGAKLIGFCSRGADRLNKIVKEFDVRGFTSIGQMLADPDIDAVNVCLPNHIHYDAVIKIAAAKKHCLLEKPPAMTLRETDAMIAACRASNVKFGCTVQCRVRKAVQVIRQAVQAGRFGKILHADAYVKWFRPADYYRMDDWRSSQASGAGVTIQHAFHYIDLLQYLVGPARRVQARMSNLAHQDVPLEDTLLAFVDYQNGAQGVVQASTAIWPGTDLRIEINGTHGTAIVVGEKIATWQFKDERPEDAEVRQLGNASQATGATGAAAFGYADHAFLVKDLVDAVQQNREVFIPVADVRPTLEMVLAMYQSAARNNAPVDLPIQDDDTVWRK